MLQSLIQCSNDCLVEIPYNFISFNHRRSTLILGAPLIIYFKFHIMVRKLFFFLSFISASMVGAQSTIIKPEYLNYPMDSIAKASFDERLDSFFISIGNGTIVDKDLSPKYRELTRSQLQELTAYETRKDSSMSGIGDKQLLNVYPISDNEYFISVAYIKVRPESHPVLFYKVDLVATNENGKYTFSVPLGYLTRYWKSRTVGNITYHFRDSINGTRAKAFDGNNTAIARKMGLEPEKLDFYMCDNFQELSSLLGFGYSTFSNGKYRDGYGVDAGTIFAIDNNEDFSHDMFHYYSGKVNDRGDRNWITEEGLAYLWGNAYYTDKDGGMVAHGRLVEHLKTYISNNQGADLYKLFSDNDKIYTEIVPEASVRSTISGIIAKEVYEKEGKDGIFTLINAGREDRLESFLKATETLIGINRENFNGRVKELIEDY